MRGKSCGYWIDSGVLQGPNYRDPTTDTHTLTILVIEAYQLWTYQQWYWTAMFGFQQILLCYVSIHGLPWVTVPYCLITVEPLLRRTVYCWRLILHRWMQIKQTKPWPLIFHAMIVVNWCPGNTTPSFPFLKAQYIWYQGLKWTPTYVGLGPPLHHTARSKSP